MEIKLKSARCSKSIWGKVALHHQVSVVGGAARRRAGLWQAVEKERDGDEAGQMRSHRR